VRREELHSSLAQQSKNLAGWVIEDIIALVVLGWDTKNESAAVSIFYFFFLVLAREHKIHLVHDGSILFWIRQILEAEVGWVKTKTRQELCAEICVAVDIPHALLVPIGFKSGFQMKDVTGDLPSF
jgi:hypothetical protein